LLKFQGTVLGKIRGIMPVSAFGKPPPNNNATRRKKYRTPPAGVGEFARDINGDGLELDADMFVDGNVIPDGTSPPLGRDKMDDDCICAITDGRDWPVVARYEGEAMAVP
jgi:hypothetical protein